MATMPDVLGVFFFPKGKFLVVAIILDYDFYRIAARCSYLPSLDKNRRNVNLQRKLSKYINTVTKNARTENVPPWHF